MTTKPEDPPPQEENKNHTFVTHRIPWYVHLIWVTYWLLAISYILYFQFPALRSEILNPP
jgi:hypothetical protein